MIRIYECALCVSYDTPIEVSLKGLDQKTLAAGYFRKLIVRANSITRVKQILRNEADEGRISWKDSSIKRLTPSEASSYGRFPEAEENVLFRSGFMLFPVTGK